MDNARCDSNQITRDYLDSLLIEMRHIDSRLPDTHIILFGQRFSMPIATAALSHLNNTTPDGMKKMAAGALSPQMPSVFPAWGRLRRFRPCVPPAPRSSRL